MREVNCRCDHCGQPIDYPSECTDIWVDTYFYKLYDVDLCKDCYRELREYIQKFVGHEAKWVRIKHY